MKEFADLLQAVASVFWPILVFIIVIWFKKEIKEILKRIKRGKILGQELELEEDLNKLNRTAVASASEVASLPPLTDPDKVQDSNLNRNIRRAASLSEVLNVLDLAESSPKAALVTLAIEIEKELREIIFSQGQVGNPYNFTMRNAIDILRKRGPLPDSTILALDSFIRIRNKIVHAG